MPVPTPETEANPSFMDQIRASSAARELTQGVIRAEATPPFFLVHFPRHGNWVIETEGLEGPTWLPELQRIPIEPGTLVFHQKKHRSDPIDTVVSDSIALLQRRGAVVIPPDIRVAATGCYRPDDPESGFGYIRELSVEHPKTRQPGIRHIDAWETPKPALAGRRLKFTRDRARYNRWLLALVEEGYIKPPIAGELDPKKRHLAAMVDRHAGKQDINEEHRERLVTAAEARVEQVEVAEVPQAVEMVRAGTITVRELIQRIDDGEADEHLAELLVIETRKTALAAIKRRIEHLKAASDG